MQQDLSIARRMLPLVTPQNIARLLATPDLLLSESGPIRVCYAPFDHIESKARLVVVGITPGMTQAVNALTAGWQAMQADMPLETALGRAKLAASFSGGAIRSNLVAMLDAIGVARHFGIGSTADLFRPGATGVHFTSALRYPVFVDGKNYNGSPDMLATPLLRQMVETHLAEEAAALPKALWLPLGPKAQAAVQHLVRLGHLDANNILAGLPHPSGANAERVAVFLGRKDPDMASRRTNAALLLAAFRRLEAQIRSIRTGAAA